MDKIKNRTYVHCEIIMLGEARDSNRDQGAVLFLSYSVIVSP